jgi:hypothetical protein
LIIGARSKPPEQLAAQVADLEAVEHTIKLFDPDAKLGRAKPLPSPHAALNGEMRRGHPRGAQSRTGPITSLDVARQVIAVRELPRTPR